MTCGRWVLLNRCLGPWLVSVGWAKRWGGVGWKREGLPPPPPTYRSLKKATARSWGGTGVHVISFPPESKVGHSERAWRWDHAFLEHIWELQELELCSWFLHFKRHASDEKLAVRSGPWLLPTKDWITSICWVKMVATALSLSNEHMKWSSTKSIYLRLIYFGWQWLFRSTLSLQFFASSIWEPLKWRCWGLNLDLHAKAALYAVIHLQSSSRLV